MKEYSIEFQNFMLEGDLREAKEQLIDDKMELYGNTS